MKKLIGMMNIRYIKQSFYSGILLTGMLLGLFFLSACKDDTISPDVPIVVVGEVTDIDTDGATFHGQIVNEGRGFNEVGFVWDESASPGYTSSRKVVPAEKGIRHFSARVSADHQLGKGYTVKAYLKTGDKFTFSNSVKFTSKGSMPPVIVSFSPTYGTRGSEVLIRGKNFSPLSSHISVSFGSYKATVLNSTDSTIQVKLPNTINTSDEVKVAVTVSGNVGTSKENFIFIGPEIKSVNPSFGSCGELLIISGSGFTLGGTPQVIFPLDDQGFEGYTASIKSYNDSFIEVYVPVLWENFNSRILVKSGNYNVKALSNFQYYIPKFMSILPTTINPEDTITISGNYLGSVNWMFAFQDGGYGNYLSIIEVTSTKVTAVVPKLPQGLYNLKASSNCGVLHYSGKLEITNSWKSMHYVPMEVRSRGFSVSYGNSFFMGLGVDYYCSRGYFTDFWEYNLSNNQWKRHTDFPVQGREQTVATEVNGKILVGTGNKWGEIFDDFWLYDIDLGTWQPTSALPGSGRRNAVLFKINEKVFCGMGHNFNGSILHDMYEYDFSNEEWIFVGNFPLDLHPSYRSQKFIYNNKGYYIYHDQYNIDIKNVIFEFDPASKKWTEIGKVSFDVFKVFSDGENVIFTTSDGSVSLIDPLTWKESARLPALPLSDNNQDYFGQIHQNKLYIFDLGYKESICKNDIIYLNLNDYR